MPRALSPVLLWVLTSFGCSVTASLGGDDVQGTTEAGPRGTSSVTSTSSGGVGGSETTDATDAMMASTTDDAQTTSTQGGTTLATSSTSSSSGADEETGASPLVCQGPSDASCLSCLRDSCCSALELCLTTPLCACLLGCLEFAPDFFSCLDIPACDGGPAASELQTCATSGCGPACDL